MRSSKTVILSNISIQHQTGSSARGCRFGVSRFFNGSVTFQSQVHQTFFRIACYSLTAADANALRPDEALSLDWDTVKSVTFTVDDAAYTVEHKGNTFTINGDEVDFDAVKEAVDGLKITEYNSETTDKKQELAFTVTLDNKEHPELAVTVQQYDGENCLVTLNGTTLGFASRSNVVSLTEAVKAITLGLE